MKAHLTEQMATQVWRTQQTTWQYENDYHSLSYPALVKNEIYSYSVFHAGELQGSGGVPPRRGTLPDPFIKLDRFWRAVAAVGTLTALYLLNTPFANELIQHSPQGVYIGVKLLADFLQGSAVMVFQVGLEVLEEHRVEWGREVPQNVCTGGRIGL